MNAEHAYPRADKAARTVDPLILSTALDHIAATAARSRSQTRRLRWIEQRALIALRGEEFRAIDVELPKSAGPATPEKLQKRMAYHIAVKHELLETMRGLMEAFDLATACCADRVDFSNDERVSRARAAILNAEESLGQEGAPA